MPFEPHSAAPAAPPIAEVPGTPGRFAWLRAQGLGVICGFATVVLLAVGSVVIPLTRDGASADLAFDEIRPFFTAPSVAHLWFYLLVPVFGLYALNVLLATWHNVVRKWRTGQRALSAYAPAVIHLSFLVALCAHLVGGLFSQETGRVLVGLEPTPLGDGRLARVISVDVDRLPGGMPKTVRAVVEVAPAGGGAAERHVLGYNQPLSRGFGVDLHLLQELRQVPGGARLSAADAECAITVGESCTVGRHRVWLRALEPAAPGVDMLVARLAVERPGAVAEEVRLMPGGARLLADGTPLQLAAIEPRLAVLLRGRHAAGNPWALAAAALLGLGVLLMGRRFFAA
jgi:hypothetical protein